MAIRYDMENWLHNTDLSGMGKATLVFHTSCVNFQDEDLNYLAQTGLDWCVPDNVRVELEILKENAGEFGPSAISCRAARILDRAKGMGLMGRVGRSAPWDLEQLYIDQGRRGSVDRGIFSGRTLVFLFGERYKMYEFLEYSRELRGHWILLLNEGEWLCSQGRVASLSREHADLRSRARNFWSGRECMPVGVEPRACPGEKLRRIRSFACIGEGWPQGLGIPGSALGKEIGSGSYASVHRSHKALGGELVKIFTDWDLVGNGVGKIRTLVAASGDMAHLPLAMPQRMLKCNHRLTNVIGYTMKELEGRPAHWIIMGEWPEDADPAQVLRRMGALLIEVHARGMLVNDLSYNNVLVSGNGKVGFVDCDSFQYQGYPGGQITPIYRHRDLEDVDCERVLRKPMHEYFAFAVLMYQLIMGVIDPLDAIVEDVGYKRTWKNTRFPLDWDTRRSDSIGDAILERWVSQDEPTRKLFADVFCFRRSYSIGAILRDLGLL